MSSMTEFIGEKDGVSSFKATIDADLADEFRIKPDVIVHIGRDDFSLEATASEDGSPVKLRYDEIDRERLLQDPAQAASDLIRSIIDVNTNMWDGNKDLHGPPDGSD